MSVQRANLGVFYPIQHADPHRRGRRPHNYYMGFVRVGSGPVEPFTLTDRELTVIRKRVAACPQHVRSERWPAWKKSSPSQKSQSRSS